MVQSGYRWQHRAMAALLGLVLVTAGSCSPSRPALSPASQSLSEASTFGTTAVDELTPTQAALWQQVLDNPGVPGIDYDPQLLEVRYLPLASVPPAYAGKTPPAGQRAADQANAILREDPRYEALTDAIAAAYGLTIRRQVYLDGLNYASFAVPEDRDSAAILTRLRADFGSQLSYATFVPLYWPDQAPNDPDFTASSASEGSQWGQVRMGAADAYEWTAGDPEVIIAVVDSGVRLTHEELAETVLDPAVHYPEHHLDIANDDNTMEDNVGHGTQVAGVVGAQGDNARTIAGLAYGCRIMPVKVGESTPFPADNCVAGCLLASQLGAKAINASFGNYQFNLSEQSMVNTIYSRGQLLVASAGNDGSIGDHYPSAYDNAFGVSATDPDDSRTDFSNYGINANIAAPGQWLKSCDIGSDSDYEPYAGGTSIASPLAAGACALLWCCDPALTSDEIRGFLVNTGAPTIRFYGQDVYRIDLPAALRAAVGVQLTVPPPRRLAYRGNETFAPTIVGIPDEVTAYFAGSEAGTKTEKPWSFVVDTSGVVFDQTSVSATAWWDTDSVSDSTQWFVDNTTGVFPLEQGFENGQAGWAGLDLKNHAEGLLTAIKAIPDTQWTIQDLATGGPAQWQATDTDSYRGDYCCYFGEAETYGAYETDALLLPLIDLAGVAEPTLVFFQRYNIREQDGDLDSARVLITADRGLSFTNATLAGGGDARFAGYQAEWTKAEIDLSAFAAQQVHIVFVFESDNEGSGEQEGEPAGWWVDQITIATGYDDGSPYISGASIEPYSVFGEVPGLASVILDVAETRHVAAVTYVLDFAPVGVSDASDLALNLAEGSFSGYLNLPTPPLANQLAELKVSCQAADATVGNELSVPFFVFNQLGDTNTDGAVDQADLDGFAAMIGLTSADAGYLPFFDSNLDGVIEESDAAAVGYFWGE